MAPTAPPVEGQLWFNTDPITADPPADNPVDDLPGRDEPGTGEGGIDKALWQDRVVIVVFWSAGCEASLRRLQQVEDLLAAIELEQSESEHGGDVLALAVHTPRFPSDDDTERLRHVIARHRLALPIVHDPQYLTWNRYGPTGWPSTAVIDRRGRVTGIVTGCADGNLLESAVRTALVDRPRRRRRTDTVTPLPGRLTISSLRRNLAERLDGERRARAGVLFHPEGVSIARSADGEPVVAIADTGNDRILLGGLDPAREALSVHTVLDGLAQPTDLAFVDSSTLAVVERGHNAVSIIGVDDGTRVVVSDGFVRPVGLAVDIDQSLVIADAGADRIFRAFPNGSGRFSVAPIAGIGVPGTRDGSAGSAELAQPVAVARTPAGLVFCDAASSNIRLLTDDGMVANITDSDMFDWGLVDGLAHRARLQRPSGLTTLPDGSVVIADTGNNRLRLLSQRRISTLGLGGLLSPVGLAAVDSSTVLVADTHSHRVVAVQPNRHQAWPLRIDGVVAAPPATATVTATATAVDEDGSATRNLNQQTEP